MADLETLELIPSRDKDDAPHHIIRRVRLTHCKRGPAECETCREMDAERLCLLAIYPPSAGLIQRRLIEIELEGEMVWRAFDVMRVFDDAQEARSYARGNGIEDVEI